MEYQLYAQVSAEIEQGQKEPGVWAKAFADAKGDEQKTKAIYIELMVERLALAHQSQAELLAGQTTVGTTNTKKSASNSVTSPHSESTRTKTTGFPFSTSD